MLFDTRPGSTPDISSDVKAVGMGNFLERFGRLFQKMKKLQRFPIGKIREIRSVTVRDNHEMPAVVRIKIHQNVAELAARNNIMLIIFVVSMSSTQNASALVAPRF